ncbi:MAG: hypothetical protein FRX48_04513 [Lasallia pustulata]|uniref:C3H1-type domain-containing protein n=1 Tax=Lasallia pustulata TaxID=136370 RepID=A0A5M8PRB5_9LECA|nr:MAG: hypothetical protein FRX48_04513 [Lasallia pustulata]
MPAVLCKFWQRGHCKNGDRCNFEHPGRGNQFHSQNRFGVFQSPGSNASNSPGTGAFGGSPSTQDYPYHLTKDGITDDLTKDLPIWILSAYGPGRDAPRQLFGGHPREQSFEEARLRYYELTASGNPQQAIQEAQALVNNAEQQIQAALNDVDGGIKYIINGENEHPNRLDICKAKGENLGQSLAPSGSQQHLSPVAQASSFGLPSSSLAPQTNKSTGFSLPSTLGWPTPAFASIRPASKPLCRPHLRPLIFPRRRIHNPLPPSTTNGIFTKPTTTPDPYPSSTSNPRPQTHRDARGLLRSWNNKPITYIDNEPCYKRPDGAWEKVWFPDGAPVYNKMPELPLEMYDEGTKENYRVWREEGRFPGGLMPELAPRREWCRWDF